MTHIHHFQARSLGGAMNRLDGDASADGDTNST